jgi:thioredoxin-related protein
MGVDARELRLLMFDAPDCEYCQRFEHELGEVYPLTAEGRRAPLERIVLAGGPPARLSLQAPVRYTPTFVLVEDDRELGRITGYPGEDHFWGLLGMLLEQQTGGQ